MSDRILKPLPITLERFAPFGDVVGASSKQRSAMNDARFERFDDLLKIEVDDAGRPAVSIARSRAATALPYRFDTVERHPLGSQAFIPLARFKFIVVVAAAAESVEAADLEAFVTNGSQGINYRRGTWHMPLIALAEGDEFLIIDRSGTGHNCDQHVLSETVVLQAP
jgi:ureidoglycolate lyase